MKIDERRHYLFIDSEHKYSSLPIVARKPTASDILNQIIIIHIPTHQANGPRLRADIRMPNPRDEFHLRRLEGVLPRYQYVDVEDAALVRRAYGADEVSPSRIGRDPRVVGSTNGDDARRVGLAYRADFLRYPTTRGGHRFLVE